MNSHLPQSNLILTACPGGLGAARPRGPARATGRCKAALRRWTASATVLLTVASGSALAGPVWKEAPIPSDRNGIFALDHLGENLDGPLGELAQTALSLLGAYYGYIAFVAVVLVLCILPRLRGGDPGDPAELPVPE